MPNLAQPNPPQPGRLIAVVGPSGVGKDAVMAALCASGPDLQPVRRVITRATAASSEDFDCVSEPEFLRRRAAGAFVLWWQAHGLYYGIPASITSSLSAGQDLLVNLSRAALTQANSLFPTLLVLSLTARPKVLAERLAARGRESAAEILARLARADHALPSGIAVITIDNSGPLQTTTKTALRAIYPERPNL